MREVIKKEGNVPPKSVKFLYYTRTGGAVLKLLSRRFISKIAGRFLDSSLSRPLVKRYIKKHGVDLSLYVPEKYRCFNDFFTRRVRPELRPFADAPEDFPSPCDGKLSVYNLSDDCVFTVKGFTYTAESLLKNASLAEKYRGGVCAVFRLAVDDFHRYYYIDCGKKDENVFIKGKLHTVQSSALEKRRVFTENCREYTVLHTQNFGDVVQIEVGAMMVGRIVNNDGAGNFSRGTEKGKFEFGGSTIILLLEKDRVILDGEFFQNTQKNLETVVKCGERIGKRATAPSAEKISDRK